MKEYVYISSLCCLKSINSFRENWKDSKSIIFWMLLILFIRIDRKIKTCKKNNNFQSQWKTHQVFILRNFVLMACWWKDILKWTNFNLYKVKMRQILLNTIKKICRKGNKKMKYQIKIRKHINRKGTQKIIKIRKEMKVNFVGKIENSKKSIIPKRKSINSINHDSKDSLATHIISNILDQTPKLPNKKSSKFIHHCRINTRKK